MKAPLPLLLAVAMALTSPARAMAQSSGHEHHAGHQAAPVAVDPHAGHHMPEPEQPDPHAGHNMSASPGDGTQAPAPPSDHAADVLFDPDEMARARAALRREHGGFQGSMVSFDLAEVQFRNGRELYRWEGQAWFGGDIDRLQVKHEGEGQFGSRIEDLEIQALWWHALDPWFNLQLGLRHDVVPNPSRTYAVAGIEGMAPYWFHLGGQVFLSDKGDAHARIEASYDERITQRLILQPRLELNFAAQDVPEIGIGAGLSEFELGARLRYEIVPEFAPYLGVEWTRKTGETAHLARLEGEDPDRVNLVLGMRFWF